MAPEKKRNTVPRHVAVIMDGNGRWAAEHGLPRIKGHEEGAKSVKAILRACRKTGVHYLTLYAFSVENWVRPKKEINALMKLLIRFLKQEEQELHDNKVQLRVIGRISDLPDAVQNELDRVMEATAHYKEGQVVLALSYGGRTEIARSAREIAKRVKKGEIEPDDVDENMIGQNLYAPDIPDPDLMIRTSGEMRISNFLLWQLSYSELYVTDVMWPDFREDHFKVALEEYARRGRRYGGIKNK